jgi:hypothetical protein
MEKLFNRKKEYLQDMLIFLRRHVLLFNFFYLLFTGQVSKHIVNRILIVSSTILIMNLFVSPVWFCIAGGVALELTRLVQYFTTPKDKRKMQYSLGVHIFFFFATLYFSAIIGIVYFDNVNVPYNKALLLQTGASAPAIMKSLTDSIPGSFTFRQ